ncbi:SSI family serine proteinase inhibitor [Actinoplanes teichomyceticus]|uniref:Subtilisin inhibitor-like n=1 Tax=Actinoplanes teichomyceticus TaxID=1867 RepID=A0A561WJ28_ACTTI|nr:SSI family serine proteinase inhibitor [Actinoplanes teichomyceticus]TWG23858.1 subtilisin inhibitor-like [Actinoplanes teichomyceticus]GIF11902.1 protease [Actinoplanes teichomyceticus]
MVRICPGLAAVAVLAAGSPAVAAGGGPASRPAPRSELVLTYMAEAGYAAAVKLTCDPDGGGHPRPAEACATLSRVDADPARLQPADRYCILLYQPVTARLDGTWRGRPVAWTHTYGNGCEMSRATGVLFAF